MSVSILDKPVLWSYRQAADLFELTGANDHKTISLLARALGIVPKKMGSGLAKGLDRDDMERLATALNRRLT